MKFDRRVLSLKFDGEQFLTKESQGLTIGYGSNASMGFNWDVALMYLKFKERKRDETRPGEPIFHGTYNTTAYLLGLTLGWR